MAPGEEKSSASYTAVSQGRAACPCAPGGRRGGPCAPAWRWRWRGARRGPLTATTPASRTIERACPLGRVAGAELVRPGRQNLFRGFFNGELKAAAEEIPDRRDAIVRVSSKLGLAPIREEVVAKITGAGKGFSGRLGVRSDAFGGRPGHPSVHGPAAGAGAGRRLASGCRRNDRRRAGPFGDRALGPALLARRVAAPTAFAAPGREALRGGYAVREIHRGHPRRLMKASAAQAEESARTDTPARRRVRGRRGRPRSLAVTVRRRARPAS